MKSIIFYNNVPCPIIKFEKPDSYLILFKEEQKWIYESSLGYGEIKKYPLGIDFIVNKIFHRDNNMPSKIFKNGTKIWIQNNHLHRLDDPAIEYSDKFKEYYINDKKYIEKDYWNIIKSFK